MKTDTEQTHEQPVGKHDTLPLVGYTNVASIVQNHILFYKQGVITVVHCLKWLKFKLFQGIQHINIVYTFQEDPLKTEASVVQKGTVQYKQAL